MKRLTLALLLCLTAACGGDSPTSPSSPQTPSTPAPAPTTATLVGQVRNSLQQPVAGATVTLTNVNLSATTDGSGRYSLANVPLGALTMRVTAPGYLESTGSTTLTAAGGNFDWVINFPLFSRTGVGDNVFTLPVQVNRLRIQGTYTAFSSNFIVWCGTQLMVNELLGTGWSTTRYDGTVLVRTPGCIIEVKSSTGVSWSFTEER